MVFPEFDPVALQIGPIAIRWYALSYIGGILLAWRYCIWCAQLAPRRVQRGQLDDLMFWVTIGIILGGRLGQVLLWEPGYYLSHPLDVLKIWEGGMAFHGGFLGVVVAMWLFGKLRGRHWMEVTDFIAPMIPCGLAAGRIGNFINGELWGRATDLPWGMIFPQAGDNIPRHPSQLYQFAGEGVALFIILWLFARKPRPMGAVSGVFLIGYGGFRFLAEFAREPDNFLGLLALNFSMGQWLSLPMILAGVAMLVWANRRGHAAQASVR